MFILDVSGSMMGFPIDTAKHLMRDLLGRLRPTDKFNVILFSGNDALYAEKSVDATKPARSPRRPRSSTRRSGGGGTEIVPAIERATSCPA